MKASKKSLSNSGIAEISTPTLDPRPHATVLICGKKFTGLLDSGASLSCFGRNAISIVKSLGLKVKEIQSNLKTADGASQQVVGYVTIPITFANKTATIQLYIVPSLINELYLGIDFWSKFGIAPSVINELNYLPINPESDSKCHTLSSNQRRQLEEVVRLLPSFEVEGLGKTSLLKHPIDTNEARPVKQRHYPISPAKQNEMYAEIDRMLSLGVIEPSRSPWNSPIVIVRKHCGKPRLCLDSRALNEVTVKDAYPLPNIDGILSRLGDTYFISAIDLKDAFWQIELDNDAKEKTAFTVPGRSLYQFARMPFGLCNAAQTMCRLMDQAIDPDLRESVFVYIDDLLVVSADFDSHIVRLRRVAQCLRKANLTINVQKSKFAMKEMSYLGYIVGNGVLKTDPEKIRAISEFPVPANIRQLRRFLGLTGWYQRFIANYSAISTPLSNIKGKPENFKWSPDAQVAFDQLKASLTTAPVLSHPNFEKPFLIQCDASATGVGSVLCQVGDDGHEHPIAFMSKKLNAAQRNYSVTELECYAAVLSVKKFRAYVEGMRFTIITDHMSLKWLMSQKELSGRLARWSLKLQAFDFSIEHRKGTTNVVPDVLSRAYMQELSLTDGFDIDLNSPLFLDQSYVEKKDLFLGNPDRFPDLKVVDNHIFKRTEPRASNVSTNDGWRLWVPEGLTARLIKNAHDPPLASHCGIAKTVERLKRLYYWPKMTSQVHDYILGCSVCKETKAPNISLRPFMGIQTIVERPCQRLYIDFLGPYPRSKKGNCFLFIVLDQFSKFVWLKPMRKSSAAEVVKYLVAEIFHVFGVPESILSDNGVQFRSRDFENCMKSYGISHITTATHSPQANASERVNRTILSAIRAYIGSDQRTWDEQISGIACAIRNNVHSSTGFSPFFLLFGRNQLQHGAAYELLRKLGNLTDGDATYLQPTELQNLVSSNVIQNLRRAHEVHERVYNKRARFVEFRPGQEVFRRNFVQSNFANNFNAKLAKKFLKCRILKKVGTALYEIEDMQGKKIAARYHAKDLKQ